MKLAEAWAAMAAYAIAIGRLNRLVQAHSDAGDPETRKLVEAKGREALAAAGAAEKECLEQAGAENTARVWAAFKPKEEK